MYVFSVIVWCLDILIWILGEVKISCSVDANAVVRFVYVVFVAVLMIMSVDVLMIMY